MTYTQTERFCGHFPVLLELGYFRSRYVVVMRPAVSKARMSVTTAAGDQHGARLVEDCISCRATMVPKCAYFTEASVPLEGGVSGRLLCAAVQSGWQSY